MPCLLYSLCEWKNTQKLWFWDSSVETVQLHMRVKRTCVWVGLQVCFHARCDVCLCVTSRCSWNLPLSWPWVAPHHLHHFRRSSTCMHTCCGDFFSPPCAVTFSQLSFTGVGLLFVQVEVNGEFCGAETALHKTHGGKHMNWNPASAQYVRVHWASMSLGDPLVRPRLLCAAGLTVAPCQPKLSCS